MLPCAALAWPVDWVHDVEAGKEKFIKLPTLDWFEVDEPSVAQVEWVEASHELILIGLKPGRATVLLGAEGKVAAWRIRVSGKPVLDDKALATAKKACADFRVESGLSVTVGTDACRVALLVLFQTDAFEARSLKLTFDGAVLQHQLRELHSALKPYGVTARYSGAGLVLDEPELSVAQSHQVLWHVLRHTVGRFALDVRHPSSGEHPD